VNNSKTKSDKILNQIKKSQTQTNIAFQIAKDKSTKAKALIEQAKKETDSKKFYDLKMQAAQLVNQSVTALEVAKAVESETNERLSDKNEIEDLNNKIQQNVSTNNRNEAENNYKKLNEIVDATYNSSSAIDNENDLSNKKLNEKELAYNNQRDKVTELKNRQVETENNIDNLKTKKNQTKKKKEQETFQEQIDAANIDLQDIKFELANEQKKEIIAKNEYLSEKNKNQTTQNIIASINENDPSLNKKIDDQQKLSLDNDIAYFGT